MLLAKLRGANVLDFSRAAVDGSRIRALKGAPRPDEAPSTGAGRAVKHHLITDATGIPLAVSRPEATATTSPSSSRFCKLCHRCEASVAGRGAARMCYWLTAATTTTTTAVSSGTSA